MRNNEELVKSIISESIRLKTEFLSDEGSLEAISESADLLIKRLKKGGKIIVFGNGGSASDSQHMAAEMVVRFEKDRKALPCIALSANTSNLTATANDYDFDQVFARQIDALAAPADAVVAISTSGESPSVIEAVKAAKAKGVPVIALTGKEGGKLAPLADIPIIVKAKNTARIQEVHIMVIHILCKIIEDAF